MRLTQISVAVCGAMSFLSGVVCMIAPEVAMRALSPAGGDDSLRTLFGTSSLAAFNIGLYYMIAAYNDQRVFYAWSLWSRTFTCALFGAWYRWGYLTNPAMLISFGATEGIGAALAALGLFWLDGYSEDVNVSVRTERSVGDMVIHLSNPGAVAHHPHVKRIVEVPTDAAETTRWEVSEEIPLLLWKYSSRYAVDQSVTHPYPERAVIRQQARLPLGLAIDRTITVQRESKTTVLVSEHSRMTGTAFALWLTRGREERTRTEFLNRVALANRPE
jgi:hypothetical protein